MPKNANLETRVDWHIEHAEQCGCREIPESVKQVMEKRGLPVPPRKMG